MWPLVYIVLILSTIAAITRIHGERKDSRIGSNLILLLLMIAGSAAAFIIVVPTHSVNYMLLSRANYDITHDRFGQKMFTSASPNNGEIQSMIIDQMNAKEFDDLTRPEFRSSLSEFTQWIELVGKLFAMKGSPELIYCYITALKP